jgi:hypothetical protein
MCSTVCCIAWRLSSPKATGNFISCAHLNNKDLERSHVQCTAIVVLWSWGSATGQDRAAALAEGGRQFVARSYLEVCTECSNGGSSNCVGVCWPSMGLRCPRSPLACCAIRQDPSCSNVKPMVAHLHSSHLAAMTSILTTRWASSRLADRGPQPRARRMHGRCSRLAVRRLLGGSGAVRNRNIAVVPHDQGQTMAGPKNTKKHTRGSTPVERISSSNNRTGHSQSSTQAHRQPSIWALELALHGNWACPSPRRHRTGSRKCAYKAPTLVCSRPGQPWRPTMHT